MRLHSLLVPAALAACAHADVTWNFDRAGEVTLARGLRYASAAHGTFSGWTEWDPYIMLDVPDTIDANKLRYLTVRLYSSKLADILDIYYKSPDGAWCLGGRLPIKPGWCRYEMDLQRNNWRETVNAAWKLWGGPSREVAVFRVDPGNQEDRWVVLDYVRLSAEPPEGLTGEARALPEPRAKARLVSAETPEQVTAGDRVSVRFELDVTAPETLTQGTAFVRLRRGSALLARHEEPVELRDGRLTVAVEFKISRYISPGDVSVEAGVYEVELDPPREDDSIARLGLVGRAGTVRPPTVTVESVAGDPTIHVDGRPIPGMFFCTTGRMRGDLHQELAQAGIHIYSDWFGASIAGDLGHRSRDERDYATFDQYFATILEADPEAWFLPHVYVTPPAWWQKENPDELCRYADGGTGPCSFASQKWRQDMGEDLQRLLRHLQRAPYADRVLGYIICSGHSAEWQMWGIWSNRWADYSAPAVGAFRRWLAERYGDDDALRRAWGQQEVTLGTAEPPSAEARHGSLLLSFRDPVKERQVIDYYRFLNELTGDAILHFMRVAREATGGTALLGTYYGYLTQHHWHQQDSGHLGLQQVLESPDVDFLMSPPLYTGRQLGGTSGFMSATDSVKLHGKLWIDESDHRTFLSDRTAGYGRTDTIEDSTAVLWREFAAVLTRRCAVTWFDMASGWFSDAAFLRSLGRVREIAGEELPQRRPFRAEIAVFIDPESYYYLRPAALNQAMTLDPIVDLPRLGAPADVYILPDLARDDFPEYRVYLFLNAFYADEDTRRMIARRTTDRECTVVWCYAPGLVSEEGLSAEGVAALTGVRVAMEQQEAVLQIAPEADHPLCAGLPEEPFGCKQKLGPVLWADDPDAEVLGRLTLNGEPGLVRQRDGRRTTIYAATMHLPPALLRNIAREAGAHIYGETDDACYADGRYIALHAQTAGAKTLRLPEPRRVRDAITGEVVAEGADQITVEMEAGGTVFYELIPAR